MPRLAANLSWMFQEWPFLDRFAAAADAGFAAVEYLFPYAFDPDDIAGRLQQNKLGQVLFNVAPGDFANGERGIAVFPDRRAEFRGALATALRYAQATATPRLHVMAGVGSGSIALDSYKEALCIACEAAPHLDILIEPINGRDIPGYLMNSFELAAQIIEELKLPNLKLQFDIYHRQMIQDDLQRGIAQLFPIIGHVQVASPPNRNEPGMAEVEALCELDALGYAGWVGCEYRPTTTTLEGLGWRALL